MELQLIQRARSNAQRVALEDDQGTSTYDDLLRDSAQLAGVLLCGRTNLDGDRVGILVPPGRSWVVALWAIWRAGGMAVPFALAHPRQELNYVIDDSQCRVVVVSGDLLDRLDPDDPKRPLRIISSDRLAADSTAESSTAEPPVAEELPAVEELPRVKEADDALLIYTSGTTGRPKGVVTTHANLRAQMSCLEQAWGWNSADRILEVLPLHHVHGIVNVVLCSLWAGACCRILPKFDASRVWQEFERGGLTLFMAVPTIYVRLIDHWQQQSPNRQRSFSDAASKLRLMVSGSAALPVPVLETWQQICGHFLLERYGMSEIGMALSNPLTGERRAGAVGTPLPGVEVRLVDEAGQPVPADEAGEVEVRGTSVFRQYWQRPKATQDAFRDGWFRTGDMAIVEEGAFRLLGRTSVDILKCGGEKISALEIEAVLRNHPTIVDCAVVGVADQEWGQRVAVATELLPEERLKLGELRSWAKERLAVYKVPTLLTTVSALPRNALGKVIKPEVLRLFDA